MIKKSILITLVKTTWTNKNVLKVNGIILYGKDSHMAHMPTILGEFGELTLHGAN